MLTPAKCNRSCVCWLETRAAQQHLAEFFTREIDGGVPTTLGWLGYQGRFDTPLLVLLGGAVIDLDDRDVLQ